MINTCLCSHMVKNGSLPKSLVSIHILRWSSSSSSSSILHSSSSSSITKKHWATALYFVVICKANWCSGVSSGNLGHNQQNNTGAKDGKTRHLVPALLKMLIRGWRPLKCNLGLLFHWSSLLECTDELLVSQQGQNVQVRKRECVNVCLCVSMKNWLLMLFSGACGDSGGHWSLCSHLLDLEH